MRDGGILAHAPPARSELLPLLDLLEELLGDPALAVEALGHAAQDQVLAPGQQLGVDVAGQAARLAAEQPAAGLERDDGAGADVLRR